MSSFHQTKVVLNVCKRDLLTHKSDGPPFLYAEDGSTWPEYLKMKMGPYRVLRGVGGAEGR